MLLSFRFENFRSFKEEQELSMIAGSGKEKAEVLIHASGVSEAVLPISATYGANASGKSNILYALRFVVGAVERSHWRWVPEGGIPREPFAGTGSEAPSSFAVDFLDRDVRYQYSFSVNDEIVLDEWLYAYPKGKRQMWFTRRAGKPMSFGEKLTGDNRVIENLTRPNSLFLSAAAQSNHQSLLPVHHWFSGSINVILGERWEMQRTAAFCGNPQNRSLVVQMLSFADLGIADLQVKPATSMKDMARPVSFDEILEAQTQIRLVHRVGGREEVFAETQESAGTIAYLGLLGPIITAIRNGRIVCVDEFDSSLHPNLALQLIRLFNDKTSNPKGAQLIFNTHDTNVLSSGELRRDEIWFTEKSPDGVSRLYSLGDFKPRKEENVENGYLQGRFGAVPFMNVRKLRSAMGATNETA
jgi:AAA15 family ATPase/GTPase